MYKQYLKKQIGRFVAVYDLKLRPAFDNIDAEAEQHGNHFFEEAQRYSHPDAIDPADIAEDAMDRAYEHWDLLRHGRYVLLAATHRDILLPDDLEEISRASRFILRRIDGLSSYRANHRHVVECGQAMVKIMKENPLADKSPGSF